MIQFQTVRLIPRTMGQSVTVTPTPPSAVTVTPPPNNPGAPALFLAGIVGGAALGWGLSILAPKVDSKIKMDGPKKIYGAIGGALGGLAGVGTTLLLKG